MAARSSNFPASHRRSSQPKLWGGWRWTGYVIALAVSLGVLIFLLFANNVAGQNISGRVTCLTGEVTAVQVVAEFHIGTDAEPASWRPVPGTDGRVARFHYWLWQGGQYQIRVTCQEGDKSFIASSSKLDQSVSVVRQKCGEANWLPVPVCSHDDG